ncbi:hypothetical protein LZ683_07895 [Comamonas testosteroni]|uniref:hypothetical protein n=1 Tax=Comamonas testosteroni TaxID=285 RepID=UPI0023AB5562|nr:hypothetical protein [Comamonas testosteroni]WEE79281.1 hypothetical protein LZ683_07895 [Comamonas testosteroni]
MKTFISILMLLACGAAAAQPAPKLNERLLRAALEDSLKDADSAKFKNIRYKPSEVGLWKMCGQVNAKNGYGAYSGFERFIGFAIKNQGESLQYLVLSIGEAAESLCAKDGLN